LLAAVEQGSKPSGAVTFKIVNDKTIPHLIPLVISALDRALSETEWAFNNLRTTAKELDTQDSDAMDVEDNITSAHSEIQDMLYVKVDNVMSVLIELVRTSILGSPADLLLKCVMKLFKTLTLATKNLIELNRMPSEKFEALTTRSGEILSPAVSDYVQFVQTNEHESSKARISKEAKAIPNLVFAIEKYEVLLIKLEKQSKVKLLKKFKRTAARDFRINVEALNKDDNGGEPDESERQRPQKKAKKAAVNGGTK